MSNISLGGTKPTMVGALSSVVEPRASTLLASATRGCLTGKKQRQPGTRFISLWNEGSMGAIAVAGIRWKKKRLVRGRRGGFVVVSELSGQYEDTFQDVKTLIIHYFTYKAAKTVPEQLNEMDPTRYMWFYGFLAKNNPGDGKPFLRVLVKERQDLAERVMITRLHLYAKWMKKCDHAEIYKEISDENLELMRERLMETAIWPADDTEKIG